MYEIHDKMNEYIYNMYENIDLKKEEQTMTQSIERAKWKIIIWSVVLAALLVLFFGGGGPGGFAHDRIRIVTVAILFAAGFGAFFIMLGVTRKKREGGLNRDERDEMFESKAAGVTLGIVLAYVYLACLALWSYFQGEGSVPAGWMWFLAYSTIFLGMIVHGIFTLLFAAGKVGNGEG